ncbi:uncharacterized protein LOC111244758 isoform X2 [Varroa destructor]|uniref:Rho-GAP domain-containing protein n=1 Tax=Varroa destructor TaxID=109461 RepID=A0A7M7J7D7_VARDE|nr:uncharacterized protein LOC111244758 isoform X2 [Varroa destructor]
MSTKAIPANQTEPVKFGCALEDTCRAHGDIPGPLLVLVLCINKLGPHKRDVFRAPGHQGNVKKLTEFLEQGRLVNLDKFSVHTLASVLKKFLRKIPGGIFGSDIESSLLEAIQDEALPLDDKRDQIAQIISDLPPLTQRLLVLICGTLRTITASSETNRMNAEALGVSVAPSFFRSCDGINKTARMEDIVKFKNATRAMRFLIEQFGSSNVYGRENYEYYARMTGRALRVDGGWIFADRYPFAVHADAAAMLLGRAPPSLEISEARGETAGLCDEDQVVPPWLLPGCGDGSAGGAGLSSCASTPILNLSGVSQYEGGEVACCGRLSSSLEDNTLLPHSLALKAASAVAASRHNGTSSGVACYINPGWRTDPNGARSLSCICEYQQQLQVQGEAGNNNGEYGAVGTAGEARWTESSSSKRRSDQLQPQPAYPVGSSTSAAAANLSGLIQDHLQQHPTGPYKFHHHQPEPDHRCMTVPMSTVERSVGVTSGAVADAAYDHGAAMIQLLRRGKCSDAGGHDDPGQDHQRFDGNHDGSAENNTNITRNGRFATARCQDQLADEPENASSRHGCMQVLIKGSPAKKPNLMMHSQAVTDGLCPGTEVRVVRRETIKRECKEYRDSGLETTSLLLQTNLVEAWLPIEHLQRASDETAKQVKDSPATHKSMSFLPLVHERQTERMRTRSEWFLNPGPRPETTSAVNLATPGNSLAVGNSPTKNALAPPNRFPLTGLNTACRTDENVFLAIPSLGNSSRTPLAPLGTPTLLGGPNCAPLTNSNGNNNAHTVVNSSLSTSALSIPLSGSLLNVDRSSSTNSTSSNSSAPGIQRKTSLKRSNSRKNKENSAYGSAKRTSSGSTISAAVDAQNGASEGAQRAGSPATGGTGGVVTENVANISGATTTAHGQYKAFL